MEVDSEPINSEKTLNNPDKIIDHLTKNEDIIFKSQQIGETDLTKDEKTDIALKLYEKSKLSFLLRFGKYLNLNDLDDFKMLSEQDSDISEIKLILEDLYRSMKGRKPKINVKNRRFEALQELVKEGSYFSEKEMMRRNPLLYEQLVGQYMTAEEKSMRDRISGENLTLVNVLMDGIDREAAEDVKNSQKTQEDDECSSSSDDESFNKFEAKPTFSRWGEFEEDKQKIHHKRKTNVRVPNISGPEKELLKDEFITIMHQSFLDGKDEDFNYEDVDKNEKYDNIDVIDHDEEDKYFDSEEPVDMDTNQDRVESSEDELDIYMNALNQHPTVCQLSHDLKKLKS